MEYEPIPKYDQIPIVSLGPVHQPQPERPSTVGVIFLTLDDR